MKHFSKFPSALRINSKKLQQHKVAPKVAKEVEVTTQMVNKLPEGQLCRENNLIKNKRRRAVIVVNEDHDLREYIEIIDGI